MSKLTLPCIVLTGGPCGAKTTLMRELRDEDPEFRRWVLVPEDAPLLFQAGLRTREKSFQAAVVRLQMALEDACALASPPGAALVCHRGELDPLSYWLAEGWDEEDFYLFVGFRREELLERYSGVIHLQSTAIGAAPLYRCWPDAHGPEAIDASAGIDVLCRQAWMWTCSVLILENRGLDWEAKSKAVRAAVSDWTSTFNE